MNKRDRINLSTAEVLLACGDPEALDILTEMFAGFGVHTPRRCNSMAEAQAQIQARIFNLIIVDNGLTDGDGSAFIHWLRHSGIEPNCYAPTVLITGHTRAAEVCQGRDAGASFVLRKPVAATVMMQRILWLLQDTRKFVTSPGYCGPDRRVKMLGPPPGLAGRRHDDLSSEVGAASTPNLEQDEIDAMLNPRAVRA